MAGKQRRLLLFTLVVAITASGIGGSAVAGNGKGTRSKPYKLHTLVPLPESKGWKFRVNKSTPNANAAVHGANEFNSPPKPGRQFFMINVTMIYTGPGTSTAFEAGSFGAVGKTNVAYAQGTDDCGVLPNPLDDSTKVFSGGRITGNICFSVRKTDVSSLELFYEPLFSLNNVLKFFALK
jgi:hypothetical protein